MGLSSGLHIFRTHLRPVLWSSKRHLPSHAWTKAYNCILVHPMHNLWTLPPNSPRQNVTKRPNWHDNTVGVQMLEVPSSCIVLFTGHKFEIYLEARWTLRCVRPQLVSHSASSSTHDLPLLSKTGCLNNGGSIFDIIGHPLVSPVSVLNSQSGVDATAVPSLSIRCVTLKEMLNFWLKSE